ncbi:MAG TPA: hypothetical protein VFT84_06595 [Gemmatimonadales bacterium]|nr:hypothetical protein [Gemmatimonadales bacterium]
MTIPRVVSRLLLACLAAAATACGNDDNLADPTEENVVDTVTIGSLTGTPIITPSGFSVSDGAVRTDLSANFDFAYNIEAGGRRVFLPRAALGLPSSTTADPGLQRRDETFDEIVVARSNGYVTDEVVPVEVGERYLVRSRVVCGSLGVPLYAKLEILSFEDSLVHLKVLANRNCGYKELEPGFPDR